MGSFRNGNGNGNGNGKAGSGSGSGSGTGPRITSGSTWEDTDYPLIPSHPPDRGVSAPPEAQRGGRTSTYTLAYSLTYQRPSSPWRR